MDFWVGQNVMREVYDKLKFKICLQKVFFYIELLFLAFGFQVFKNCLKGGQIFIHKKGHIGK